MHAASTNGSRTATTSPTTRSTASPRGPGRWHGAGRTPGPSEVGADGAGQPPAAARRTAGAEHEGLGYFARAYLKLDRVDPAAGFGRQAVGLSNGSSINASPGYSGLAWGNHFEYQSRLFYLPQGEPTVVWTALIGHAFVDAWESQRDERWLDAARSVTDFILNDLERRELGRRRLHQLRPVRLHGRSQLERAGRRAARARRRAHGGTRGVRGGPRAVDYTVGCQHADGSWWYGEAEDRRWVRLLPYGLRPRFPLVVHGGIRRSRAPPRAS